MRIVSAAVVKVQHVCEENAKNTIRPANGFGESGISCKRTWIRRQKLRGVFVLNVIQQWMSSAASDTLLQKVNRPPKETRRRKPIVGREQPRSQQMRESAQSRTPGNNNSAQE